ncbi:MAG: methyltransferase [Caulobacteraceae bacterium]
MMFRFLTAGAIALTLFSGSALAAGIPASIAAAVADSGRPAADTARDAARKPSQMLAFAGVKPGDTVLEILPGGGYFTRILSKAVGPAGHVFAAAPDPKSTDAEPAAAAIAANPAYRNVSVIGLSPAAIAALPPLDMIWTAQNYHDLHLTRVHVDVPAIDKLWFGMLKPGGVLLIIDHVALAGAPVVQTADTLHRIDPAAVRREVEAAGFVFDGESDAIRNPADPHTALVFDPKIRGRTDQFVFRFRKP